MNIRQGTTIAIRRYNNGTYKAITTNPATLPLTEGCVRRFKLMEEDCVVLDFTLATPVHFALGDRYFDELFGFFYVTREQMPEYDTATGGYRYRLQLDREYMGWRNHKLMLTVLQGTTRTRKESTWTLTGKLSAHLEELGYNLAVLGYSGYTFRVESTCGKAAEVRCMQYNSVDILTALGNLAEEYECEWWVDTDKVIHLGKCESSADPYTFSLATNVESMTIQDNRNTYANKIYVMGSTNNVPTTYRKELMLTLTGQDGSGVWLADHAITPGMFPEARTHSLGLNALYSFTTPPVAPAGGGEPEKIYSWIWQTDATESAMTATQRTIYTVNVPAWRLGAFRVNTTGYSGALTLTVRLYAQRNGLTASTKVYEATRTLGTYSAQTAIEVPEQRFAAAAQEVTLAAASYGLKANVTLSMGTQSSGSLTLCSLPVMDLELVTFVAAAETSPSALVPVKSVGGTAVSDLCVRFNPLGRTQYDDTGAARPEYTGLLFYTAAGESASPSVSAGTSLVLDDGGSTLVPTAYYATPYDDPAALARIGEQRLQLPTADAPGGYLLLSGVDESRPGNVVEGTAIFDGIYPDGKLKVETIKAEQKTDYTKYEGETATSDWQWQEYTLGLQLATGGVFPFDATYQLPNTTLQVRFLTPEDIGAAASSYAGKCLLAGMTFDVQYNRALGTYTIVRNDDYGTLLPNNVLRPQVGDPCVLIGWNVKALGSLGLVADAEARLLAKGREYVAAMEEAQFTFECHMPGSFMFDLAGSRQFMADGQEVNMADPGVLYVDGGYSSYVVPVEGFRVSVQHGALKEAKTSRVIGYELNLAEPYRGAVYTIGETAAYSRLAKIEREITNS